MAAVMKEAVRRDEEMEGENQELIARLYTENKVIFYQGYRQGHTENVYLIKL